MTAHYTHIEAEAHKAVAKLIDGRASARIVPGTAYVLVAEADGNRTRQRRGTPLTGFEVRCQRGRLCSYERWKNRRL